jgi:hypothetical protein
MLLLNNTLLNDERQTTPWAGDLPIIEFFVMKIRLNFYDGRRSASLGCTR